MYRYLSGVTYVFAVEHEILVNKPGTTKKIILITIKEVFSVIHPWCQILEINKIITYNMS